MTFWSPNPKHQSAALQGAILNGDLSTNLSGVFDSKAPNANPVSAYSYFAAACSPVLATAEEPATACSGNNTGTSNEGDADGAELVQFIDYAVSQGQQAMANLGYAVLPLNSLSRPSLVSVGSVARPNRHHRRQPTATIRMSESLSWSRSSQWITI